MPTTKTKRKTTTPIKRASANKSHRTVHKKRPTRLHKLLRLNRRSSGFTKKKFLIFILAFAVIGGAYMAYRSFADTTMVKADGEFTAITPARILDTRDGTGGVTGPVTSSTKQVQIAGKGGIPATGVKAVVMNVTVTDANATSQLVLWASGQTKPSTYSLSYTAGQTAPSQVTVELGSDGKINMANNVGNAQVIFDVVGFTSTADGPEGARYTGTAPTRILDTRSTLGGINRPINSTPTSIAVRGVGGVPANATAVVMNVTVVGPTNFSHLSIWPSSEPKPLVSSLNYAPGQTIANMVTVKIGADGRVNIANNAGTAHVIFDVAGYYAQEETGYEKTQAGRYVPIAPKRFLDTRTQGTAIGPAQSMKLAVAGKDGVPYQNTVDAVVMNVTVLNPSNYSHLTISPDGSIIPTASNLNFSPGQTVANQVIVKVGSSNGQINIFNNAGNTNVVVDIVGYIKKDIDTAQNYAFFSYNTNSTSRVDYDIRLNSIPPNTASIQMNSVVTGFASGDTGYSNFVRPILDFGTLNSTGSKQIIVLCSSAGDTCKPLAPGATIEDQGTTRWIRIPYVYTTGVYKFSTELLRNTSGYPGLWSKLTMIAPNGTRLEIARAKMSNDANAGVVKTVDMNMSNNTSCSNPIPFNFAVENIAFDGAVAKYDPEQNPLAAFDPQSVNCPGIVQMTYENKNGNAALVYNTGQPKASRDVIAPTINSYSFNADKSQLTIRTTDNKNVVYTGASIDNTWVTSNYDAMYFYTPDKTLVFNTSWVSPGQHTLVLNAFDNSGNYVTQTATFTK